MELNRPLQIQRLVQRRPPKKAGGRYKVQGKIKIQGNVNGWRSEDRRYEVKTLASLRSSSRYRCA
jgi:hypothetical protein